MKTYDEFCEELKQLDENKQNTELNETFNDGYNQALQNILEMIEGNESYQEMYENIVDMLDEGYSNKLIGDINLKGNRIEANRLKELRRKVTDNWNKQLANRNDFTSKQKRKFANDMGLGAARNSRDKIEDLKWKNN